MSLGCSEMFLQYTALFISSQECQCLKSCHFMQTSCPSNICPLVLQAVNINYACHVSWDVTCTFHSTTDDCRQFFRWTCLKFYPAVAKSKGSSQSLLISSGRIFLQRIQQDQWWVVFEGTGAWRISLITWCLGKWAVGTETKKIFSRKIPECGKEVKWSIIKTYSRVLNFENQDMDIMRSYRGL